MTVTSRLTGRFPVEVEVEPAFFVTDSDGYFAWPAACGGPGWPGTQTTVLNTNLWPECLLLVGCSFCAAGASTAAWHQAVVT